MLALLVLLQAAATTTIPAAPSEKIDLMALSPNYCPVDADPNDIVVCAKRHSDRLGTLPDKPGPPDLPPATIRLPGGGTVNLHAEDGSLPGGHGIAAMITVKIPF